MARTCTSPTFTACALACGLAASAVQAAGPERGVKPARVTVKTVPQPDGSVIARLDLPGRTPPASPEEWLQRMADPTRNGAACKDPKVFAEWLDATTEPRFMSALASMAMDPSVYPKALGQLFDPATAHNWSEFVDPVLYLKWMGAGLDPKFYQALFNRLAEPGKWGRWAASPALAETQGGGGGAVPLTGRQDWLKLPAGDTKAGAKPNPWLADSAAYRY